MSPVGPTHRKVTRVAVGVLLRADGAVLLADRPAGKPYAGYWEFPGGKIEPGEPVTAALERELHEELGIDIGPSVPWVTFEFDYPHAYVELQFRRINQWRGEPNAREGQQFRFVDPAGLLPHPLLPAAVPALRWLRLPRVALATAIEEVNQLDDLLRAAHEKPACDAARIVVVDADWRGRRHGSVIAAMRQAVTREKGLLLVSGPGASQAAGSDGVVFEAGSPFLRADDALGWRGIWVDSQQDLQLAVRGRLDFVMIRSAAVVETVRARPTPLPAFLPAHAGFDDSNPDGLSGQGRWIELRPVVRPSGASLAPG